MKTRKMTRISQGLKSKDRAQADLLVICIPETRSGQTCFIRRCTTNGCMDFLYTGSVRHWSGMTAALTLTPKEESPWLPYVILSPAFQTYVLGKRVK